MTGLIVSHNEGHLIGDRLRELRFCEELVVIDVASTDDTASVAGANGARVVPHPFTRIAELVHPDVAHEPRNDLIVIPDPDEEIPPALAAQLVGIPEAMADDEGTVVVPRIYYFRGRPLRGTVWGGTGKKILVVSRSRAEFIPAVHRGVRLRPGYRSREIPWDGENAMRHHWTSGYREFLEKHVRYIGIEGPARALTGEITGYRALVRTPYRSFRECYFTRKGYLDGVHGLALSVLYALYMTASNVQLIRELRRRKSPSG
ncbi:MAG: hypothetical protein ACR2MU_06285 [Gaiellaceae bacterium]